MRKSKRRKCKIDLATHFIKNAIERNFPLSKLKEMIVRGKWLPHIKEKRRTCVYKNGTKYWTIIIIPIEQRFRIIVITVYPSHHHEKKKFKYFRE